MSSVDSKYKKFTQIEHVLKKPGMYVGSVEAEQSNQWLYNNEKSIMENREITYVPALYKIFDEILVNAIDQKSRNEDPPLRKIKIDIDKETGSITICNDGKGIPIEWSEKNEMYVPELIFGNLLTSSNYDDKEERVVGGTHGLGAKLTAIFSTLFRIETIDSNTEKKFIQEYKDNLSKKGKAKITSNKGKPYTKITFIPDYEKFGMEGMDEDTYLLMQKRTYDVSAVTPSDVSVYFNGEKVEVKNFEQYASLYLGSKSDTPRVYESCDRWEILVAPSQDDNYKQVSFVNGICTKNGGKHVDYILSQIVKKITFILSKKLKDHKVRESYIKDRIWLFVKSTIVNPSFSSQIKDELTTPKVKFGSSCEISDGMIKKIINNLGIIEDIVSLIKFKATQELGKTDAKGDLMLGN